MSRPSYDFSRELAHWGPDAGVKATPSVAEAEAYCRRLSRAHYENFPVVTWLLPRKFHRHFHNVYAYCRWADDLADEVGDAARSLELLAWWRSELDDCYAGTARHPVFVALKSTVDACAIPRTPFEDLISAFEQDQRIREYASFDALREYCRRSADPVGRLVLYICGEFNADNAVWSDSICTGLQLANFWQDVARDLDIGRVYLPEEDRARFGYSRDDLRQRTTNDAFVALMEFEVARAREFLQGGLPLVGRLPGRLRADIELFSRGGLKLLDGIEAIGYRVWDKRPVIKKRHAVGLLAGCLWRSFWSGFGGKRNDHHDGRTPVVDGAKTDR